MRCRQYGVELPALFDHEAERPNVLHDVGGDLAGVGDAWALLLVAEEDDVVSFDQGVQLPVGHQVDQEVKVVVVVAGGSLGRAAGLSHQVEEVAHAGVGGPRGGASPGGRRCRRGRRRGLRARHVILVPVVKHACAAIRKRGHTVSSVEMGHLGMDFLPKKR